MNFFTSKNIFQKIKKKLTFSKKPFHFNVVKDVFTHYYFIFFTPLPFTQKKKALLF